MWSDQDIVGLSDRSVKCFVNQRRKLRVPAFIFTYDEGLEHIKSELEILKLDLAEAKGRKSEPKEGLA